MGGIEKLHTEPSADIAAHRAPKAFETVFFLHREHLALCTNSGGVQDVGKPENLASYYSQTEEALIHPLRKQTQRRSCPQTSA